MPNRQVCITYLCRQFSLCFCPLYMCIFLRRKPGCQHSPLICKYYCYLCFSVSLEQTCWGASHRQHVFFFFNQKKSCFLLNPGDTAKLQAVPQRCTPWRYRLSHGVSDWVSAQGYFLCYYYFNQCRLSWGTLHSSLLVFLICCSLYASLQ